MADICEPWEKEFGSIDFGDTRLKARLVRIAEQLSNQPLDPINQACGGWADTKAAYRLFSNEKVEAAEILKVHRDRTWERAQPYPVVLAIQDTSFLNYTGHEATLGLGKIGTKKSLARGLVQHTTLAMSPQGLPLGVLDQKIWARKPLPSTRSKDLRKRPLREKESTRWLNALEVTLKTAPEGITAVTVADRECDIYEFITHASRIDARFLIRAARDRTLFAPECGDDVEHLWKYLGDQKLAGHVSVDVPARGHEAARTACVSIQFAPVELKRPRKQRFTEKCGIEKSTSVYAVLIREITPPPGLSALEWMLLTNIAVTSLKEAIEKMNWYRSRWGIEVFHKILKSGCRVESCRLGTAERLTKYLALFAIIAWRLHWITQVNRDSPDQPCTALLAEVEWKALYCKINKTRFTPRKPPSTRQAVRWIAQLGGFLARKGDKEPGIITVWRGWQRLADVTEDCSLFNKAKTCG
ncbi:MAG: IS4 family transposase [Methylotenera sp.]|nr:IS4 family transposase [Oligoflexia bacterium]